MNYQILSNDILLRLFVMQMSYYDKSWIYHILSYVTFMGKIYTYFNYSESHRGWLAVHSGTRHYKTYTHHNIHIKANHTQLVATPRYIQPLGPKTE